MGIFNQRSFWTRKSNLTAGQHYNRKQRKHGFFAIVDKKGRFGKWNPKTKKATFHYDLEDADMYSYKDVITIWQLMGMTNRYQIRMRHTNQRGEKTFV